MNNIVIALEITALGMGLVFAMIILLWWLMILLASITSEKEAASGSAELAPPADNDIKAKAAAVAVAIAFAEQQASLAHPLSDPPPAMVSAWQLGTRTRQLYEKGTPILHKPRKIG